jgi:predicted phage terminase large subunit-like protein
MKIVYQIIEYQRIYGCVMWAFEAVQFQEFLRTQLLDISVQEGCPVPARAVTPHVDKELRIEGLQPFVERGLILLHPSQQSLLDEMRHYPDGEHVDGLDALEMLWKLAIGGGEAAGATVAAAGAHQDARRPARMTPRGSRRPAAMGGRR